MILIAVTLLVLSNSAKPLDLTPFWKNQLSDQTVQFQSFAGYEEVDWYRPQGQSGIYYQLFGARGVDLQAENSKVPLIIWLQGGPGASSLFGAYTEVGPVRINQAKAKLKQNSWNLLGHLLFIDQPLNVGFSYDKNRSSQKQVSSTGQACSHLLNFLYNFYQTWPKLQANLLYINGESFGGRYAVGIAQLLLNNATFRAKIKLSLKGVIISSGWMDPSNQINYYDSLLYSTGIVSNRFRDVCSSIQTKGIVNIYKNLFANASENFDFLTRNANISEEYWGGMSFRNWRNYDEEDFSMDKYVQTYKKQLGVMEGVDYIPENEAVYNSFREDLMKSFTKSLLQTLSSVRVLIYSGQNDYIVNSAGVQNYINALGWSRINTWKSSKKQVWRVHNQVRGWAKTYGNLWYVLVNGAGHKITSDQPQSCFNLLGRFIYDDRNWNQ